MNKRDALKILFESAEFYYKNLLNNNFLIVYNEGQSLNFIETIFLKRNFYHLTGVNYKYSTKTNNASIDFFNFCLSKKLPFSDFEFNGRGTTVLKLDIIKDTLNIMKTCKMIGDFDKNRPFLCTNKIAGNISACIGFIKSDIDQYYIPNTILKEDVRNVVSTTKQVVCIFKKAIVNSIYNERVYLAKKIDINNLRFTCEQLSMISPCLFNSKPL